MMSPSQLPEGTEVRLVGLKNPDLNGKYGRVAAYIRDGERVMVKLQDGRVVKLKPKQIEEVEDGGGGGDGGRGPPRRDRRSSIQQMNNNSNHSMGKRPKSSGRSMMEDNNGEMDTELMDTLKSADAMFDIADTDGDGLLSAEEFEYYMKRHTNHDTQMIRECFMMIDADGNGDVTRDEVREAFLKKRRDLKGDTYEHTDDKKKQEDSLLTAARDADALFDKADVDGSGQISKREFEVFMKRNTNHTDEAMHKLFDSMDVDGDGQITREEVRKAYLKQKSGGEKVSLQELLGLEDDDMAEIEEDVYNMFFLSDSFSTAFWYAIMVWSLKLGLILMIAFDQYKKMNISGEPLFPDNADVPTNVRAAQFLLLPVNVAVQQELITTFSIYANLKWGKQILELNPGATKGKYHIANAMRCVDGLAFLFINTTLLLQATEVLGAL